MQSAASFHRFIRTWSLLDRKLPIGIWDIEGRKKDTSLIPVFILDELIVPEPSAFGVEMAI